MDGVEAWMDLASGGCNLDGPGPLCSHEDRRKHQTSCLISQGCLEICLAFGTRNVSNCDHNPAKIELFESSFISLSNKLK